MWWTATLAWAGTDGPPANTVRGGIGAPFGLGLGIERRLAPQVAIGAEGQILLVAADTHAYVREYLSVRPVAPYASLRVGASVAGNLSDTFWNGFAVGPEVGVQARAQSGFTFEVKVAADAVLGGHVAEWVPRLGPNVAVIPQASVWFGGSFGRTKVR